MTSRFANFAPTASTRLASAFLSLALLLVLPAAAVTITGTVTDATTGKPAAGDDVVLLNLSQGMNEVGRTKTDAQGRFKLQADDSGAPKMVRVNHQGVNYFPAGGPIRPGETTADIKVYDSAKKLDAISTTVRIMRLQTDSSALQVLDLIAVKNASDPPRALMSDRTYEFYLPQGATLDQSVAQSPGGMPVSTAPVPESEKGRYYFNFPLRPGETRFEVAYHLPYTGEATIVPKLLGKADHFVVMMPNSMEFGAKVPSTYSPMPDDKAQANVQVAVNVNPAQDLSFRVKGSGTLPDTDQGGGGGGEGGQQAGMPAGGRDSRPGGGLGTPEGTPDPLHQYRWAILGACAALLALGAFFVVTRSQNSSEPEPAAAPAASGHVAGASGSALLVGLKDELFQLELERQQGRISAEEYAKTKAALDQTLKRALSRTQPRKTTKV